MWKAQPMGKNTQRNKTAGTRMAVRSQQRVINIDSCREEQCGEWRGLLTLTGTNIQQGFHCSKDQRLTGETYTKYQ